VRTSAALSSPVFLHTKEVSHQNAKPLFALFLFLLPVFVVGMRAKQDVFCKAMREILWTEAHFSA
jgi:hypothetical protein